MLESTKVHASPQILMSAEAAGRRTRRCVMNGYRLTGYTEGTNAGIQLPDRRPTATTPVRGHKPFVITIQPSSISYVDINMLEMCHQTLGLYSSIVPQWLRPESHPNARQESRFEYAQYLPQSISQEVRNR